jgi:hypothetical protein
MAAGKPAQAAIQIYTRAARVPGGGADNDGAPYSQLVASLTSDKLGNFRVGLPAGDYVVSAMGVASGGRSTKPTYATVRLHTFTHVTVQVSGAGS